MLLIQADARKLPIPDGYVQTVITSPPYWGLRDYGTGKWSGGDPACDHKHETQHQKQGASSQRKGRSNVEAQRNENFRDVCGKCGAQRLDAQLGAEPTPEAYVQDLVEIFREVRRVLREDGTVWLNLGDSYAANRSYQVPSTKGGPKHSPAQGGQSSNTVPPGLKSKDLVGIPWRVAFALQADGWYLRSDIIWAKPNPMPESVTDRPTRSHEYVFLLTKRERYYYDAEAVKEANSLDMQQRAKRGHTRGANGKLDASRQDADTLRGEGAKVITATGRNRRTVWTITPKPYKGAHFATFPPELVEPCLRAGSPEGGCCAACGSPLKRVIERGPDRREQQRACGGDRRGEYHGEAQKDYEEAGAQNASEVKARILAGMVERRTVAWSPTCDCGSYKVRTVGGRRTQRGPHDRRLWYWADWQSRIYARWGLPAASVVLDPFCGSGTTGQVAQREGRFFIGLDLKMDYLKLAQCRITGHGC